MRLSKSTIANIPAGNTLSRPGPAIFDIPETVLQFGTGVFIRGLIDYFIDKANKEELFKGRVVMVKSTAAGDIETFRQQDCLYTLLMKSVDEGIETDEKVICAAVSRVLDAKTEWDSVLACADNPAIRIVISNTTEAGIAFVPTDRIDSGPSSSSASGAAASAPSSFPGKLLAFLHRRWETFSGSKDSGLVIVPTELIPDNATKLRNILHQLAQLNNLSAAFINWMNTANDFCNSLVDRIVPGRLPADEHRAMEKQLGYEDEGMIMSESFGLWAIETRSPHSRELLSFSKAHPGIHLVDNIEKFRELKLRLLNGSHNLSCALGFIAGFHTVKEAMADPAFDGYMRTLILQEIASAILSREITMADAREFGSGVLDRYRNPYIGFEWLSICVQDTSKIRIRAVPIMRQHYAKFGFVGDAIALGMAAYILFMRSTRDKAGQYEGTINGKKYAIDDEFAANLHEKWQQHKGFKLVQSVLRDQALWETDLSALAGFDESVTFYLENLDKKGFSATVPLSFHELHPAIIKTI
jgi:tagaturonate reductase